MSGERVIVCILKYIRRKLLERCDPPGRIRPLQKFASAVQYPVGHKYSLMPERLLFLTNFGLGQINVFLAVADALLQRQARDGIYSATFSNPQSPDGGVLCQKRSALHYRAIMFPEYSVHIHMYSLWKNTDNNADGHTDLFPST